MAVICLPMIGKFITQLYNLSMYHHPDFRTDKNVNNHLFGICLLCIKRLTISAIIVIQTLLKEVIKIKIS